MLTTSKRAVTSSAIDIERLSGVTRLSGQVVTGGTYTVPTDVSPLRRVALRRTG